jgi:hypothetical protein
MYGLNPTWELLEHSMVSVSEVSKMTVEDGSCHGTMARTKEEEGDSAYGAVACWDLGSRPPGQLSYTRQQYEALRPLPGLQFQAPGTVLSCGRFIYVTCAYVII